MLRLKRVVPAILAAAVASRAGADGYLPALRSEPRKSATTATRPAPSPTYSGTGELQIDSTVRMEGLKVYLDKKYSGTVPLREPFPAGPHALTITAPSIMPGAKGVLD